MLDAHDLEREAYRPFFFRIAHIVNQGQNRIELCGSLVYGGGLTPTIGLVRQIKNIIESSRIMVMVRPRTGSFIYTPEEINTMIEDIKAFKAEGVRGVVFGCLTEDGAIDEKVTKQLVAAARPLDVTFHRAFDISTGLDTLQRIGGITRLLTSGHGKTVMDGAVELSGLISHSSSVNGPIICPASGINNETVLRLHKAVPGLKEVHLTGSGIIPYPKDSRSIMAQDLGFGAGEWHLDPVKIERVWDIVKDW
ncbi:CutC family-domain-containing protein [Kockovaella imperatae]|uniref:Copper homeostasis protein cutC homolog n=1 Tax=Kockovaella imperatae TaxID=4999 RepID=A0A1Y1USI2_9TREE|nr:CutC family-domain-containing protein [Kockovaella imperatae]ORX40597.1 CutC family-domain-containing protein [Kockovaella imperatae]